jgi:YbgC/YbaW family acyl-CoA thioester hydrolase
MLLVPPISEYRYQRRVQFAETDMAGVVHFSWYFRYLEEAEHALWRAAGLSIAPPDSDIGFPRVSASVDFLAPLHFEDEFEVWIRIEAISRRSIRYASTITCRGTSVATGTVTAACVQKRPPPMRAADIPESIASRLASRPITR